MCWTLKVNARRLRMVTTQPDPALSFSDPSDLCGLVEIFFNRSQLAMEVLVGSSVFLGRLESVLFGSIIRLPIWNRQVGLGTVTASLCFTG
jgi:hypothetical protein